MVTVTPSAAGDPRSTSAVVPRFVVAAPGSGHGKTTVATGVMAALRARGLEVAPFKVGPDYIDPGYHLLAAGRPGRNLDPVLLGMHRVVPLFRHGAATPTGCDVAVVEGVMGLFDGRLGSEGEGSTAQVARRLRAPVVLVVDVRHASRTVAAIVHGMASFDPQLIVGGVILNQVGSPRHAAEVVGAVRATGLPVLGALPRHRDVEAPSRHLGLVPAAERPDAAAALDRLAARIATEIDLDVVLDVAGSAPPLTDLDGPAWHPERIVRPLPGSGARRPRVAVAAGRAFTFRYPETDELLRAAGCDVVEFDPTADASLPPNIDGLYLGGGFPQVYAGELADNNAVRADIGAAVAAGLPTVAECAGLLYLCRSLDEVPMAGVLPQRAVMTDRLTLGYRNATTQIETLLARPGEHVTGHEFHRTVVLPPSDGDDLDSGESPTAAAGPRPPAGRIRPTTGTHDPAWLLGEWTDGVSADPSRSGSPTLHASYLHVHWAGHPHLAQRFADAVHRHAARRGAGGGSGSSLGSGVRRRPLRAGYGSAASTWSAPQALTPSPQPQDRPERPLEEGPATQRPLEEHPVPSRTGTPAPEPRDHHGDQDLAPGLVDLAVNVRPRRTPGFLVDAVVSDPDWSAYPRTADLTARIAAHHGVPIEAVLPTAGAAEAFLLAARALAPSHPLVVHPQFSEPERALRVAGHDPDRLVLDPSSGFTLDPRRVPHAADLVVVGNPTNPTSVLHSAQQLGALRRPGRVLLVDEAFMDAVPDEPETMLRSEMAGLLVLRSLTKSFGIAGLRAGYVVGDPELISRMRVQQPPWSVGTPAVQAMLACLSEAGQRLAAEQARQLDADREDLVRRLTNLGCPVVGPARAPFLLLDTSRAGALSVREELAERGFAVRRGETFPGLGPTWIRVAVRDPGVHARFAAALHAILTEHTPARPTSSSPDASEAPPHDEGSA